MLLSDWSTVGLAAKAHAWSVQKLPAKTYSWFRGNRESNRALCLSIKLHCVLIHSPRISWSNFKHQCPVLDQIDAIFLLKQPLEHRLSLASAALSLAKWLLKPRPPTAYVTECGGLWEKFLQGRGRWGRKRHTRCLCFVLPTFHYISPSGKRWTTVQ